MTSQLIQEIYKALIDFKPTVNYDSDIYDERLFDHVCYRSNIYLASLLTALVPGRQYHVLNGMIVRCQPENKQCMECVEEVFCQNEATYISESTGIAFCRDHNEQNRSYMYRGWRIVTVADVPYRFPLTYNDPHGSDINYGIVILREGIDMNGYDPVNNMDTDDYDEDVEDEELGQNCGFGVDDMDELRAWIDSA